jgi:hypothetical protein
MKQKNKKAPSSTGGGFGKNAGFVGSCEEGMMQAGLVKRA